MATKKKEINYDDDSFDLMPPERQDRILKKFKKAILEDKKTPEGRRRLAGAFGGKPSDYKPA